jgi:cytochrome c-type biogenesis protein CcmE
MKPRKQRMAIVAVILVGVAVAVGLTLQAFEEGVSFFYSPSELLAGDAPAGRKVRMGGLVLEGSVVREPGSMEVVFDVTDLETTVQVSYTGVLPDLFRDGQGVVAHGVMQPDGQFVAEKILAKHDENYMSPEVADMLADKGHPADATDVAAN